ncbi:MAG: thioredoxin [Candidatus Natronoplasma sp.]
MEAYEGSEEYKELEKIKKKMVEDIMSEEEYPEEPIKVNDADFQDTLEKYPLVLVDFWAAWCGPCKMMEPVLEELAEDIQGALVVGKMNVDENSQVPSQFQVSSIPTLVLFKDGEPVERLVGAMRKEQLAQKVKQYVD